jgi:uncharacterized protein YdeI (YjbR/CyaY-like superfamily)
VLVRPAGPPRCWLRASVVTATFGAMPMPPPDDATALVLPDLLAWREWLAENGERSTGIWLVTFSAVSGVPSVRFREAIEHALAYGWVDSKAKKRDAISTYLRFSPRGARSTWGPGNRRRVERLEAGGLMTPAGARLVELAKADGRWPDAAGEEKETP